MLRNFLLIILLLLLIIHLIFIMNRKCMIKRIIPQAKKISIEKMVANLEAGDIIYTCNRRISYIKQYGVFVINNLIGNVFFHALMVLKNHEFVHFVHETYKPFYYSYFNKYPNSLFRKHKLETFFKDSDYLDPIYGVFKKRNSQTFLFEDLIDEKFSRLRYVEIKDMFLNKKSEYPGVTCNSFLGLLLEEKGFLPKAKYNINCYYNPKTLIEYVLPYLNFYKAGVFVIDIDS